jgi:hypothetical protein
VSIRKRIVPLIGITFLALAATRPAHAQLHFGPQLNWASNSIGVGVGGRLEASLSKATGVKGLGVIGSFDFFFPGSNVNYFEVNANGTYAFEIPNSKIAPYAGAGLVIAHTSVSNCPFTGCSATNVGLNLLGGVNFPSMGTITPFAELRLELRTGSAVVITGGVLF